MVAPTIANSIGAWDASVTSTITTPDSTVTEWRDLSPNGRHWGPFNVAPSHSMDRVIFSGVNNCNFEQPTLIPATEDWTAIVRLVSNGRGQTLSQSANSGSPRGWQWVVDSSSMEFRVNPDEVYMDQLVLSATQPFAAGKLFTAAIVRSGATWQLWAGGVIVASVTDTGVRPIYSDPTRVIQFGRSLLTGQEAQMDVYRLGIWPFALSGVDMAAAEYWAATGEFPAGGGTRQLLHSPHLLGSFP